MGFFHHASGLILRDKRDRIEAGKAVQRAFRNDGRDIRRTQNADAIQLRTLQPADLLGDILRRPRLCFDKYVERFRV